LENGNHREDCSATCKVWSGKGFPMVSCRTVGLTLIRKEQAFHISLRDRAFFAFLVDERMKSAQGRIIQLRDKILSNVAPQPLLLLLNYTATPTTLSLIFATTPIRKRNAITHSPSPFFHSHRSPNSSGFHSFNHVFKQNTEETESL
jgi:hypothetical protein